MIRLAPIFASASRHPRAAQRPSRARHHGQFNYTRPIVVGPGRMRQGGLPLQAGTLPPWPPFPTPASVANSLAALFLAAIAVVEAWTNNPKSHISSPNLASEVMGRGSDPASGAAKKTCYRPHPSLHSALSSPQDGRSTARLPSASARATVISIEKAPSRVRLPRPRHQLVAFLLSRLTLRPRSESRSIGKPRPGPWTPSPVAMLNLARRSSDVLMTVGFLTKAHAIRRTESHGAGGSIE
jgi:hypothetical protein